MGRRRVSVAQPDDSDSGLAVEVVDVDGEPVPDVNVQALVGDWRRAEAQDNDTDNESTVAYSQPAGFDERTGGDGVASLPSLEEWEVVKDYEPSREGVFPPPVNPLEGNPQVTLIGTHTDVDGTEWFGTRRLPLESLRAGPTEIRLLYKRLFGPRPLTSEKFGGDITGGFDFAGGDDLVDPSEYQNDVYGAVAGWHAVPTDGAYLPSTRHRLFVEVHAARKQLELVDTDIDGRPQDTPAPAYPTIDAVGPASAGFVDTGADPDSDLNAGSNGVSLLTAGLLQSGALRIEVPESVSVQEADEAGNTGVGSARKPLATNIRNEAMYAFGLATASAFQTMSYNSDDSAARYPAPLYPHLRGAFGERTREKPSTSSSELSPLEKSMVKGLIGVELSVISEAADTAAEGDQVSSIGAGSTIFGELLGAWDRVNAFISLVQSGSDFLSDDTFSLDDFTNKVYDGKSPVEQLPNRDDAWGSDWKFVDDQYQPQLRVDDEVPSAFGAVHRIPIQFDEPVEVTFRGYWSVYDKDGREGNIQDLLSVQREISPDVTPSRGGD
jgi:hypothetical protein